MKRARKREELEAEDKAINEHQRRAGVLRGTEGALASNRKVWLEKEQHLLLELRAQRSGA